MTAAELLRGDLRHVSGLIVKGSRVLDLGCGDGALLAHLRDERDCRVRGVELDPDRIAACVRRGVPVVQTDLDSGLEGFPDDRFDYVILSQTLQVVHRPALVLREMLRVGTWGVVSFPNFGHWGVRAELALKGRMPVSRAIPYTWYDTPNIHHTTIRDFREFCSSHGARITEEIALRTPANSSTGAVRVRVMPNLRAETAIALVTSA